MKNKIKLISCKYILGIALGLCFASGVHAQEDLQDLRGKPKTTLTKQDTVKKIQVNPIQVPIPKLGLEVNYWKHWTKFGINANQSSFSDNWSAGGVNSFALGGTLWHKSDYTRNDFNFVTEVDLKYGKIKNDKQLAKKNIDRVFWDNKMSHKISAKWALFFSLTFESQFDVGYTYMSYKETNPDTGEEETKERIKDVQTAFMGPGYFTESFGLEYKPDKTFSLRLGTGTARQTLMIDSRSKPLTVEEYSERYPDNPPIKADQKKFGLDPGYTIRNDLAFQITANLDRNLTDNLNLKSRYNLFADYKELKNPDHRLDVTLSAKVTKLVNVTLTGIMLYDNDWKPDDAPKAKVQWSQALALGMVFALPR